ELNRYAADDSGEEILPGESENDRDDPRAREQSCQLRFGMIPRTQNKKQRHQKNNAADDFTEKMRNWRLPFLFEIEIPNVAIHQRDDEQIGRASCRERGEGRR